VPRHVKRLAEKQGDRKTGVAFYTETTNYNIAHNSAALPPPYNLKYTKGSLAWLLRSASNAKAWSVRTSY